MNRPGPVTELLAAYRNGEINALRELMDVVTPELRRAAGRLMSREKAGHLLRPTGLVNEAFLRLFNGSEVPFANTREFMAASVRHMRRVLMDYGRMNLAAKRQAGAVLPAVSHDPIGPEVLVDLNRALEEMAMHQPRAAQIVEMKFYAGLSIDEIASVLESSPRTVVRDWEWARAFLVRYLSGVKGEDSTPLSQ